MAISAGRRPETIEREAKIETVEVAETEPERLAQASLALCLPPPGWTPSDWEPEDLPEMEPVELDEIGVG